MYLHPHQHTTYPNICMLAIILQIIFRLYTVLVGLRIHLKQFNSWLMSLLCSHMKSLVYQ